FALAVTAGLTAPVQASNDGTAKISNVVSNPANTYCVRSTTSGPNQFWNVQQGGTYTVTLSGVTECSGDTIGVIVKSTDNGNQFVQATKVSEGVYTFDISMSPCACNTNPILYCTNGNDPSTGYFARDASGNPGGHLRAAIFDANCNFVAADTDCTCTPP